MYITKNKKRCKYSYIKFKKEVSVIYLINKYI